MSTNTELLLRETNSSLTEKQKLFLTEYTSNGYNARAAAIAAGYHESQGTHLCYRLKNEILEVVEGHLLRDSIKAAQKLSEFLSSEKPIPNASQVLEAAKTVLDRVGLAKKERIEIDQTVRHGIFIMPEKTQVTINQEQDTDQHSLP